MQINSNTEINNLEIEYSIFINDNVNTRVNHI
jgi:hypothetical protein